jgi:peptide/nickel transport system substrate-binding protein
MKVLLSRSAISKVYAAIIAIIVIVAIIAGAWYYTSMPGPSPSPSASTSPSPSASASPSPSPVAARVLITAHPTPWKIDPARGSDLASTSSILNLYDPLVFPNNVGNVSTQGPVKPWIATSWTASADGLTWTFTIRQNVTFHSGRTLNATDVAFSMNRLLTIGEGFAYIFEPYVANATATNQWTVVFNMKRSFGPFLISLVRLYIVDSTEVMSHIATPGSYGTYGDYGTGWLVTNDAGSGPFKVKQNLPEASLDMIRFANYWGYMAPLAPTEYKVIAEPTSTTEYTMMLADQVSISSAWLPETTIASLQNVSGIYIANIAEPNEYYYMMNLLHPPLDDIHVRKALAYCLNYTDMVSKLYPRYAVATSCVPAGVNGYANTTIYNYNVTAAQAELKLSKYYPDIVNHPDNYAINFYWISAVPIREQDALYFATDAQAIGLKVNVIAEPWNSFVSGVADPSFSGMANVEVDSDYPEAGSLLASRYSNNSMGTWTQMEWFNSSTFDSMLTTALSTINTTQRYADYAQLQQYIINNCVGMNICDFSQVNAVQSYIRWPMAQDPMQAVPVMGYNYDGRLIEILSH